MQLKRRAVRYTRPGSFVCECIPLGLRVVFALDDVAVGALWQASVERSLPVHLLIVQSEEAFVAATEGDAVVFIGDDVGGGGTSDGTAEGDHATDDRHTMFANPTTLSAGLVRLEGWRGGDPVWRTGVGWSLKIGGGIRCPDARHPIVLT